MNTKVTLLFLILLSSRLFGQLQIDAGNDTIICVGVWGVDTTEIGGNPTATGGIEPYVYSWSTNYRIGSNSYGASYFLDDSTKSNPRIINDAPDNLKFKLQVVDDSGTQAEDSIKIRFSRFGYLLMDCIAFINQGDTVSLFGNMGLGIEPLSYFWSPNYNISDTSEASPKAWPDTTVNYYVYATDSIGCVSEISSCWISVNTTGIFSIHDDLTNSKVFPNPITNYSTIKLDKVITNDLSIHIISATGQTVLIDKFYSTPYLIGDKIFNKGIYIYVIKNESGIISYGRFVKE